MYLYSQRERSWVRWAVLTLERRRAKEPRESNRGQPVAHQQRIEHRDASYLEGVPVLAGEGVLGLLLKALLTLGKSLVPAGGIELAVGFVVEIVYHRITRATYLPTAILTNAGR